MIFTKGAYQSAKFQKNVDNSGEFHQIRTLIGSFCWKYIQFQLKKVQRSYVSWYWRLMQNLKKNQFVISKLTRTWWTLIWALKNLHFDWSYLCKVYNLWPKKYRRVIFHDTEESCKIWRNLACGFKNDMKILANF